MNCLMYDGKKSAAEAHRVRRPADDRAAHKVDPLKSCSMPLSRTLRRRSKRSRLASGGRDRPRVPVEVRVDRRQARLRARQGKLTR
ncbi:MAG UNVERIFIED_CONTAM: hypothetical protein LVR29_19435 [Microcystis novacekii LVE1205-3]